MLKLSEKQRDEFRKELEWEGPYYCAVIVKYPNGDNSYDSIDREWVGRTGIYKFVDAQGKTAYVGEAHLQDLATRVRQHLKPNDGGGDFRIAVERQLGSKEEAMKYISGCTLWFIETVPEETLVFEAIAGRDLDPSYSGYSWRKAESERRKAERAKKKSKA